MIIVRSPLRITLGGGGTDLESYYSEYGGFLLSAAINRYVYVNISTPFDQDNYEKKMEDLLVYLLQNVQCKYYNL